MAREEIIPVKIYILLSDTGSLLTKAIKVYTKDPYNHVSISLNKDLSELYSFGRKKEYNPYIGGFVKEDVHNHLLKYSDSEIYELEVTPYQYLEIKRKIEFFESRKREYKYNLLGMLAMIANVDFIREDHYFCSQFVSVVLNSAGISISNKPEHYTTPNDFRKTENMNLIFKGILNQYPNLNSQHKESLYKVTYGKVKSLLL